MRFNILILGCGNLGQRYVEGLLKSKLDFKIFIVETNKNILNKFRDNPKLECHFDFKKIKERNFDLLINSTTAENRFSLINNYNLSFNIKNFLIEKVVENNYVNLLSFERLKIKNCWVNTFLRTLEIFKRVKTKISDNSFTFRVSGGNWGLLCNSIHYIDLVSWLAEKYPKEIKTNWISDQFIPSKRTGFIEIYGFFEINFSNKIKLEIICKNNDEDLKIKLVSNSLNFDYNLITGEYKTKNIIETHLIPFQSNMTKDLVENILLNGKCYLTPLKESIVYHKFFLKHVIGEWNILNNSQDDYIPIT